MTIVVDANVVIAVLNPNHLFHEAALERCLRDGQPLIQGITRAEALIHPTRSGQLDDADAELRRLGFTTEPLDNAVADRARQLRADHGNKNFPMVDAVQNATCPWSPVTQSGLPSTMSKSKYCRLIQRSGSSGSTGRLWRLVGLITRRSRVQILPLPPRKSARRGILVGSGPLCGLWSGATTVDAGPCHGIGPPLHYLSMPSQRR